MQETVSLRFTGEHRDTVCAGYSLGQGYRCYFPGLMRFNRPDSFSPFGRAGSNAYSYCDADPVNRADPSGHMPCFQWLFNAFRQRAPQEEEIAGRIAGSPSAFLSPGDAPLGARRVIQRTTSMPTDLSRLDRETHLAAAMPPGRHAREGMLQGQFLSGLRQLPDMRHLPHLSETLANVKLTGIVRHVSLLETEWRQMKDLYTRKELDIWEEAQRFAQLYVAHGEISTGLDNWKNIHIPAVFDLPSMRANGDTHYRLIGEYLAASRRLKRLDADWAPARNFFLIPPEHAGE